MTRSLRGSALAGALLAAVLATAGCTTTLEGAPVADSAPAPAEGPGSDPVAWAGRVCDAVLSFATPATSAPDFAASADLPSVQREFSNYLGGVVTGVQQGRAQLAEVGRAPEPAGDDAVSRAAAELAALEDDLTEVKGTVDGMDAADPEAFMTTLTRAESALTGLTAPNPVGELGAAPRLQRAAERAEPCRQLSALGTPAPR
ncbi:hypothetical protein [Pseudonocardia kunmingensis]|uniref:Uncharacterized protein n=1 Tax=Pseudonocardia kunmingensis TaxID=630975 RepID=A0A543DAS0_9PSEU|nr:hypothetical protein [Pseudonocardia kunmingensis]TQM06432.1 hypothetical protein FB558_6686 [Pseudonocardia kunmingensis]